MSPVSVFYHAENFNQPLDWDVSNVRHMGWMFDSASRFNQPLSWAVAKTTDTRDMFTAATALSDCNKRLSAPFYDSQAPD